MKGFLLLLTCVVLNSVFTDANARTRKCRKANSNIYVSKIYKGHYCPKPRNIINAKYF